MQSLLPVFVSFNIIFAGGLSTSLKSNASIMISSTRSYLHRIDTPAASSHRAREYCSQFHGHRLAWIPEVLVTETTLESSILQHQLALLLKPNTMYYINLFKKSDGQWHWLANGHASIIDTQVSSTFSRQCLFIRTYNKHNNYNRKILPESFMTLKNDSSLKFGILTTGLNTTQMQFENAPDNLKIPYLCEQVTCLPYQAQDGEVVLNRSYNKSTLAVFVGATANVNCLKSYKILNAVPAPVSCFWNSSWNSSALCQKPEIDGAEMEKCHNDTDWLPLTVYSGVVTIVLSLGSSAYVIHVILQNRKAQRLRLKVTADYTDCGKAMETRYAPSVQAEINFMQDPEYAAVFFQGHPLALRTYTNYSNKQLPVRLTLLDVEIKAAWNIAITDGRKPSDENGNKSRLMYLPGISETMVLPAGVAFNVTDDLIHHTPTYIDRMEVFFCDRLVPMISAYINNSHDEKLAIEDYSPNSDVNISTSENVTIGSNTSDSSLISDNEADV